MAKDELVDSHVSVKQCTKAVAALHTHQLKKQEKNAENELLGAREEYVWLNVTVKKIHAGQKLKPVKIPIVHPLVDPRESRVCLITKDPQREYKDLLESHNIKFISRVVGIEKLKGKFKPYEARRALLKENGLFLADDRVIPLLPKLLGSKWFDAKKQPIPVTLKRKDLKGELERAINSTYMNQNKGTCTSVKVGKLSQTPSKILDNLKSAIPAVVQAIKDGWENIQSLNIKTSNSISLPIWTCSLDDSETGRWHGLEAEDEGLDSEEESGLEEEEVSRAKNDESASNGKGRKRSSDSDEQGSDEENPRKKAKASNDATPAKSKSPSTIKSSKKPLSAGVDVAEKKNKKQKVTESSVPKGGASDEDMPSNSEVKMKTKKSKITAAVSSPAAPQSTLASSKAKAATENTKKAKADIPFGQKPKTAPSPSVATAVFATTTKKVESSHETKKKSTKTLDAPAKSTTSLSATLNVDASAKPAPSLAKDDIKKKRSASIVEKKKEIIAKSKGGKSAKNAVLGRKAGQE